MTAQEALEAMLSGHAVKVDGNNRKIQWRKKFKKIYVRYASISDWVIYGEYWQFLKDSEGRQFEIVEGEFYAKK